MENRLVPYDLDFALLNKLRKWEKHLLTASLILSAIVNIVRTQSLGKTYHVDEVAIVLSMIALTGYTLLTVINDKVVCPGCENKRRSVYIDASMDSKMSGETIDPEFYNSELAPGIYKLAVNGFENCFFTYSVGKAMLPKVIRKNVVLTIAFLLVGYFGLRNALFIGIPLIQFFLSSLFLCDLTKMVIFVQRNRQFLEHYKILFNRISRTRFSVTEIPEIFRNILDYETNLACMSVSVDSKHYEAMQDELNSQWDSMKHQYSIRNQEQILTA